MGQPSLNKNDIKHLEDKVDDLDERVGELDEISTELKNKGQNGDG